MEFHFRKWLETLPIDVTMCDWRIFKWILISEVHDCRITTFSEPLHHKHALISEVCPEITYRMDNTLLMTYPYL